MLGARVARPTTALAVGTAAYVLGWTAHVTFLFHLAPVALREAGLHDADAWVFAGTAVASILMVMPAGRLADLWPRRRVIRLGLALLALSYAPLLAPPTFASVLVATAITGTGLAFLLVAFNAYVADLARAGGMGAAYGRATALGVLAGAIGPLAAGGVFALAPTTGDALRWAATIFAVGALVGVAATLALPATRAPPAVAARGGPFAVWREERAGVAPAVVAYLLVGSGSGMASPYFAVYFLDVVDVGESAWGLILGLGTAASALGALLVGALASRIVPHRLLAPPQVMLLLASLAFVAPLPTVALAAAYVARCFFTFTASPTLNAVLMGTVREGNRGRAQAWTNLAWNVGWAAGAGVGGIALAIWGGGAFVVGALLALGGTTAGALLMGHAVRARAEA